MESMCIHFAVKIVTSVSQTFGNYGTLQGQWAHVWTVQVSRQLKSKAIPVTGREGL
jgi:hypothetical protein